MKVAATLEKSESANSLLFVVPFHVSAYFWMCAHKHDVVVLIKMDASIFTGCLFCVGAHYHDCAVFLCRKAAAYQEAGRFASRRTHRIAILIKLAKFLQLQKM